MTRRWQMVALGIVSVSVALALWVFQLGARQDVSQQGTEQGISRDQFRIMFPPPASPKAGDPSPPTVHKLHLRVHYRMIVVTNSNNPLDLDEDTIAINNRGEIVLALSGKGFIWQSGRLQRLYAIGDAAVNGLNDAGQIVGGTSDNNVPDDGGISSYPGDAILWNGGRSVTLSGLEGFSKTTAVAINNVGEIVGSSGPSCDMEAHNIDADPDGNAPDHIVLWKKGRMTDLGKGKVAAINDAGQIAGTLPPPLPSGDVLTYGTHAAVWAHGQWHSLADCRGWNYVQATGINKEGSVCGYGDNGDSQPPSEAFLWSHDAVTDLGRGHALAINASGQCVGDSGGHAVLWWHGRRCDLNSGLRRHGWMLTSANGINDSGQIVGSGTRAGQYCLFLLTPTR